MFPRFDRIGFTKGVIKHHRDPLQPTSLCFVDIGFLIIHCPRNGSEPAAQIAAQRAGQMSEQTAPNSCLLLAAAR